jgi:DNA-3-methyladenine glycosylase
VTSHVERTLLERSALEVAPRLLGCVLRHEDESGAVAVRLVEVEAYDGTADPGSHAFRGPTPRNSVMFGPPGRSYVYFTYGMHWCLNVVCAPAGRASAVLVRAGEVVEGLTTARQRRDGVRDRDLARGPARLCRALDVDGHLNGADLLGGSRLHLLSGPPLPANQLRSGPRVGVSAGAERPWRFWVDGEPTVSTYRPHAPRRR